MLPIVGFYFGCSLHPFHPPHAHLAFYSGAAVSFRIPLPKFFSMSLASSSDMQFNISRLVVNYRINSLFLLHGWATKNPPGLSAPEGFDLGDHLDPLYLADPPSLVLSNT